MLPRNNRHLMSGTKVGRPLATGAGQDPREEGGEAMEVVVVVEEAVVPGAADPARNLEVWMM